MACGFCCVVQCAIALLCSSSPLGFQCPVSLCGLMGSFGLRVRVCVCVCGGGGVREMTSVLISDFQILAGVLMYMYFLTSLLT